MLASLIFDAVLHRHPDLPRVSVSNPIEFLTTEEVRKISSILLTDPFKICIMQIYILEVDYESIDCRPALSDERDS